MSKATRIPASISSLKLSGSELQAQADRPATEKAHQPYVLSWRPSFTLPLPLPSGRTAMLSSAEAVISFGQMHSPEITERLYKSF